jgi:hypothetical protein
MKGRDTQGLVHKAADKLMQSGVRPTQQNIRQEIGSGSATTIHKALGQWWLELGARLKAENSRPGLPDQLVDITLTLWDRALQEADLRFQKERSNLDEQRKLLRVEKERMEMTTHGEMVAISSTLERAYQKLEECRGEKDKLAEQLFSAEKTLIRQTAESNDLLRASKELEAVNIRLDQALKETSQSSVIEEIKLLEKRLKERERTLDNLSLKLASSQQHSTMQHEALIKENANLKTAISELDKQYCEEAERRRRTQTDADGR